MYHHVDPDLDLSGEHGYHRLVFRPPFDPSRRQTVWVRVGCGQEGAQVRNYVLDPYQLARNSRDDREEADVWGVLSGAKLHRLL